MKGVSFCMVTYKTCGGRVLIGEQHKQLSPPFVLCYSMPLDNTLWFGQRRKQRPEKCWLCQVPARFSRRITAANCWLTRLGFFQRRRHCGGRIRIRMLLLSNRLLRYIEKYNNFLRKINIYIHLHCCIIVKIYIYTVYTHKS